MDPVTSASLSSFLPKVGDFAGYWALGRLMADGAASYDTATVLALQHGIGWGEDYANLVWYAPWSLPIFWLFGLLPVALALPLWLATQVGMLFLAADRLWLHHGGQRARRWIAALLTLAFYPALAVAIWRQASALVLLGLVGFLVAQRRRRDLLAGACLALAAIKPQLLYLVWAGLVLWVWRTRRWRIGLGFLLACASGASLAALVNGSFFADYCRHLVYRPPQLLISPSLGSTLRLLFGASRYWLQFAPGVLGAIWFASWMRKHRGVTDIEAATPALTLASILFGVFFWTPDLVVLCVCVVPLAVHLTTGGSRRPRPVYPLAYFGITVAATVAHELVADHWFYWLPVAYATLFAHARRAD